METPTVRTVNVEPGARSYPIYIGRELFAGCDLLASHVHGRQVAIVSDATVAPLYLPRVHEALAATPHILDIVLPVGEQHKTLATVSDIFDRLLQAGHHRSTTLVALGGGVVGDMAGFAAACYLRGVNFVQIPTTLLAQVDSSVGGKTGVNHPLGKNMIGAFYQPQAVLIDMAMLDSLPPREFAAGLAEVIKYGLIGNREFYDWLHQNMSRLLARERSALLHAIEQSCLAKSAVVKEDEREAGRRAILNFGHSFAHAIETDQGYGNWLHGEAVAAGMVLALRLSVQQGQVAATEVARLQGLLQQAQLPTSPPTDMDAKRFLALLQRDKKVVDGQLRLVLLRQPGEAVISDQIDTEQLVKLFGDR